MHPRSTCVSILFSDEDEFLIQIVMEYVNGGDLFDRVCQLGKYTEASAAEFMRQAASALQAVHNLNILHRDVKPGKTFVLPCTC